jgi:hypothetical protein
LKILSQVILILSNDAINSITFRVSSFNSFYENRDEAIHLFEFLDIFSESLVLIRVAIKINGGDIEEPIALVIKSGKVEHNEFIGVSILSADELDIIVEFAGFKRFAEFAGEFVFRREIFNFFSKTTKKELRIIFEK